MLPICTGLLDVQQQSATTIEERPNLSPRTRNTVIYSGILYLRRLDSFISISNPRISL